MSRHPRPSTAHMAHMTHTADMADMADTADTAQFRDPVDDVGLPEFPYRHIDDAAPVRPVQPWSVWPVRILTAVGALIVGFLLSSALSAGRDVAVQQDARKSDLLTLLEARQAHNDALSAQLEDLRTRVSDAEALLTQDVPALAAQLAALESGAGLTGVAGPGVRVTFSDAPAVCSERPGDCRIQDADLQLAVNTLFALGAEAVAINGERLIATTAIRSAGGSVMVNYTVLTSPYVVEAVGNPVRLHEDFATSGLAADFEIWRDAYGLGFGIEAVDGATSDDTLILPAYSGSAQLRAAQAAAS